jgi:hypothetical protein
VTIAQHPRHLLGRLRQHDHERKLPVGGQPVGLVGAHLALVRDHPLARHDGRQVAHDLGAARQHRLVRFGHFQGHRRSSMIKPGGDGQIRGNEY